MLHFLMKTSEMKKAAPAESEKWSNKAISKELVSGNCSRRYKIPAWLGLHQNGLLTPSATPCVPTAVNPPQGMAGSQQPYGHFHLFVLWEAIWCLGCIAVRTGPNWTGWRKYVSTSKMYQSGGLQCWLLEVPFGKRWRKISSRNENLA